MSRAGSLLVSFAMRARSGVFNSAALAAIVFTTVLANGPALAAPAKGGAANLAMIGEPQTLDPMASTADLVSIIMQHVYEPLYTFDANWNVAPMLAESMPTISKDGSSTRSRCARASSSTTAAK
jgi:peptide/nickel transport system substrate-binding protein